MKKVTEMFFMFFIFFSVICIPTSSQAFDIILDNTSPNHTVKSGSDERIYGSPSSNQILIEKSWRQSRTVLFSREKIPYRFSQIRICLPCPAPGTFVTFQGTDQTVADDSGNGLYSDSLFFRPNPDIERLFQSGNAR
ncbi:MAG: hypothetical protein U5K27_06080 [Desulfotignum sp.]|nr:hypothetical protein [Desulfotignum sp.]